MGRRGILKKQREQSGGRREQKGAIWGNADKAIYRSEEWLLARLELPHLLFCYRYSSQACILSGTKVPSQLSITN